MACLNEEIVIKWISDNGWPRLEYNLGGWNVGEQAQALQQRLGLKLVEQIRCSVCTSVNRLYKGMPTKSMLVLNCKLINIQCLSITTT